ncbi:cytochrome c3 family protein [Pseudoduganella umbonata]|uniref:Class III cytochrome C domain-containing protein n=1 Tax=Pseudoduganella umbonata TaxID=864828 RepID=A0A4V1EDU8_9BURK|nr:cytochrome c3 family protein [Pseudoduganella umbonata]MBB3222091.1 hypothetical protein [Pseudoduganella umbonata]QCP12331.1 hypothetical protein FCL38_19330 [Pseudoduganella umbonata]
MTKTIRLVAALIGLVLVAGIGFSWNSRNIQVEELWQQAVVPGPLSRSHAFLANNCAACHVPVKGVAPSLCISCHADNAALLQRLPTAFHANIQTCSGCHTEHQGASRMPTTMDHAMLVETAKRESKGEKPNVGDSNGRLSAPDIETANTLFASAPSVETKPQFSIDATRYSVEPCVTKGDCQGSRAPNALSLPPSHPRPIASEANLNCASCHATVDRHQGMLGTNCVQCHATTQWTVAQFRHPSVNSTACAQCHKPPPSHNMMHFSMMSARIAGQPNAKVNQCYLCHQTTSWNDIKGVGWKKIH